MLLKALPLTFVLAGLAGSSVKATVAQPATSLQKTINVTAEIWVLVRFWFDPNDPAMSTPFITIDTFDRDPGVNAATTPFNAGQSAAGGRRDIGLQLERRRRRRRQRPRQRQREATELDRPN